jgi:hypothetical protein
VSPSVFDAAEVETFRGLSEPRVTIVCIVGGSVGRLLSVVVAVGFLAACAQGPISGRLSRPDQAPVAAILNYESSILGGSGKLRMSLPTGENFTGTYRLVPHDPKRQMTATLTGDRGSTMLCRFTLNEPGVGPAGGGSVQCQLSSGGTFDSSF